MSCSASLAVDSIRVQPDPSLDLIPQPQQIKLTGSDLLLSRHATCMLTDQTKSERLAVGISLLTESLREYARVNVSESGHVDDSDVSIVIAIQPGHETSSHAEGYRLHIQQHRITITGDNESGCFYGIQTLRQMIELADRDETSLRLPGVDIHDFPRYRWRGMLVDSARNFQPISFLKSLIDHLAKYKFNTIHWHLVDDQGWRLEILSHPKLTQQASYCSMGDHSRGGYYSQDQIRELVQYAADRFIQIIPEIELPGHCQSVLTVYPHLSCTGGPFELPTVQCICDDIYCAGNDDVFAFLKDVFDEVIQLFPAPFVHIGGDEAPKHRWEKCPRCQKRIKELGLTDESALQGWFITRIHDYLQSHSRRLIAWDDMGKRNLPSDVVLQWWRNRTADAWQWPSQWAARGHASISSPTSHCYLDYSDEVISLEKALTLDLVADTNLITSQQAEELFLGGECNVWTEKIVWEKFLDRAFPRAYAFIHAMWRAEHPCDAQVFADRVSRHMCPVVLTDSTL